MSKLDFHWIVPGLAQGSYPPKEAFQTFDVIVYCAEEKQPRFRQPPNKYLFRLPLDDDPYRPIPVEAGQLIHQCAESVSQFVVRGHPCLTSCAQGLNRSGLISALVLVRAFRMKPKDAIQIIRRKRDRDALCNPMFEQFVLNTPFAR